MQKAEYPKTKNSDNYMITVTWIRKEKLNDTVIIIRKNIRGSNQN